MSIEQNGLLEMYTIHEIMSRARIAEPQTISSEASRSAKQIAARARKIASRARSGR